MPEWFGIEYGYRSSADKIRYGKERVRFLAFLSGGLQQAGCPGEPAPSERSNRGLAGATTDFNDPTWLRCRPLGAGTVRSYPGALGPVE